MRPSILSLLAVVAIVLAIAPAASAADVVVNDGTEDIPAGTPTDDYGFVAWCYGALDESLDVYETVLPDLKAIDALFGSPVQEAVPYAHDVADERQALKRFQASITAAEKASPGIASAGVAATARGRRIWARAERMPSRVRADTWLYWGLPNRCESTAKLLKARAARPDQAAAIAADAAADLSALDSPATEQSQLAPPLEAVLKPKHAPPAATAAPYMPRRPVDPDAPVATAGGSTDADAP